MAEKLNLSRERRRAFRAGKFPVEVIKDEMIREMEFTIECAAGAPEFKEFKVTEGMLFTKVPAMLTPPIEYCDHLLEINEVKITSGKKMKEAIYRLQRTNAPHIMKIKVRRVVSVEKINDAKLLPSNASVNRRNPEIYTDKPNTGYQYYRVVLIYFPRSKLGIDVKSYDGIVYVQSTDNLWGSTARRFLFMGDAILKINKTEISTLAACQKALREGLQQTGVVTMIVERPVDTGAYNYVRGVVAYKRNVFDFPLPKDVEQICLNLLKRYEKEGFKEPKKVFTGYIKGRKPPTLHVTHNPKIIVKPIHSPHSNNAVLMKCPKFLDTVATLNQKEKEQKEQ